jgi:outer membrane receptor protein involved in Fe transport
MNYRIVASFALAMALLASSVLAQVDRATVTGVVRDESGAVVPQASVTLTRLADGVAQQARVTGDGTYQVVGLQPGEYLVQTGAEGFRTVEQTVVLEIGQKARIDVVLAVGAIGETVTVQGVTPLLDTQSAVLGTVVNQVEISKLPLALRNWDDLLFLVPGIQGDRYTEESGGTSSGRTGGVAVHGNRSLQNNFLLDGIDNNSISTNVQELSTQVSRPSIDAIGEFKVVTSPFAAEYGRAPGAAISVTTKSGTNRLRGTGYYYYRDERFDASTFFAKRAGIDKPANDQDQFGGNLGGPLARNRAFFFLDYEGTRITRGVLRTGRVATEDERRGVFSTAIRDPLTGLPFANNTIPADRIDPVSAQILSLVPRPNTTGTNNYIRQPNVADENDRILGRLDLKMSSNDTLFVRYSYNDRFRFVPGWFGGIVDGTSTSAWGRNDLKAQSAVAGWTRILGPSVVNEFRFGWARGRSDGYQDPKGDSGFDQIGFRGVPAENQTGGIVGVDISGYIRIGSPNFMPKYQHTDQYQFTNTMSWLRGNHQLKFGADILAPMNNDYVDIPSTRGNTQFSGQFTGNAMADFLLGYARTAELSNFYEVNQRRWATSFYVQDDWRASDRLTLNLGLRYDFMTPALEAEDRQANFDPAAGQLVYASDGSLEQRALVKPDRNNLAPRVGVVFRVDDATVLRGGYGIFYNMFDRIGSEDQIALNPPGLRNINFQTTSSTTPVLLMRDGFPPNFLDPANINYSRLLLRAVQRDGENALYHQFAAGVERQLGPHYVVSADFVGSLGRNIALLRNLNQPLNGNGPRPYPSFGHIQYRDQVGTSRYRGVDLAFEKRYSNRHGYRVSYTLGDSRDNAPEHLAASSPRPQNTNDLDAWEGPSDFDVRHRLVASVVAELPLGSNLLLRDWLVSGVYTARTGRPFTVTQGSLEGAGWVPNKIGEGEGEKEVDSWFDVSAFERVPAGRFGNAGRNILRGPGWMTFDLSVQRRVAFTGSLAATIRWDVFNAFNRANFGNPNADITAANRATIATLAGDPRIMQFSVRFEF